MPIAFGVREKGRFSPLSILWTVLFFMIPALSPASPPAEIRLTKANLQKVLGERARWKKAQMDWYRGGMAGSMPEIPDDGLFLESTSEVPEANLAIYEFNQAVLRIVRTLLLGGPFDVNGQAWGARDAKAVVAVMRDLLEEEGFFVTNQKIFLDGVPKDLINDPLSRTILLSLPAWRTAKIEQKDLIVVHEVLGLLQIPDEAYQTSSVWIARYRALTKAGKNLSSRLTEAERPSFLMPIFFDGGRFSNDPVPGLPEVKALLKNREASGRGDSRPCLRRYGAQPYLWAEARVERAGTDGLHAPKRLYVNWAVRCRLSAGEVWASGPAFDGESDPKAWFEIRDHRLVQDGVEVGWISGLQIYLKTENEIFEMEILPEQAPVLVPGLGDGSLGAMRIRRRNASGGSDIFVSTLNGLGELGGPLNRKRSYEEIKP